MLTPSNQVPATNQFRESMSCGQLLKDEDVFKMEFSWTFKDIVYCWWITYINQCNRLNFCNKKTQNTGEKQRHNKTGEN